MNTQEIRSLADRHNGAAAVADLLERAATKIEAPGCWTQGLAARDMYGRPTWGAHDAAAVCWCPVGAVWALARLACRSEWSETDKVAHTAVACLNAAVPGTGDRYLQPVAVWNNRRNRKQAEVVALLRQVAAEVRGGVP